MPGRPLRGEISVPGDKSISHRALILGAMAEGRTRIEGLPQGADVLATLAAVRALGAAVQTDGEACELVGGTWRSPTGPIDCGNSGTCARLLMGAAAGRPLTVSLTGDPLLSRRPMERLAAPLRRMGARIAGGPTLPLTVTGGVLGGIRWVNETASAQVKTALLLAGLGAEGEVELIEPRPSRDHGERLLRSFGVAVDVCGQGGGALVRLGAQRRLHGARIEVPGDPSSAAFPVVAALLSPGSSIRVRDLLANPLRWGLYATLEEMGARLEIEAPRMAGGETVVGQLSASSGGLRGVDVPAARAPAMIDEYPILAVAAACAEGVTVMRGLAELRVKESDRLDGIVAGLRACGVRAETDRDTLIVAGCGGPPPGGARVETHGDHRLAMAFLVLGLVAQRPVTVDRAEMIGTSFPGFAGLMRGLGAAIDRV